MEDYGSLPVGCHQQAVPLQLHITNNMLHKARSPSSLAPNHKGSQRQKLHFLGEQCLEEAHVARGLLVATNSFASSSLAYFYLVQLRKLQSTHCLQRMSSIKEHEEQFFGGRLILLV